MKQLTPILTVDAIEPALSFWTDGLGFQVTVRVPHPPEDPDGPLGFVILAGDGAQLMLQSHASVAADLDATVGASQHGSLARALRDSTPALFLEVDALDPVLARLPDAEVVVPRRTTFYGMDEIIIRAPGGALLGLAARIAHPGP